MKMQTRRNKMEKMTKRKLRKREERKRTWTGLGWSLKNLGKRISYGLAVSSIESDAEPSKKTGKGHYSTGEPHMRVCLGLVYLSLVNSMPRFAS